MIHKTLMDAMQTDDVPKKSSHLTVEEFQKVSGCSATGWPGFFRSIAL